MPVRKAFTFVLLMSVFAALLSRTTAVAQDTGAAVDYRRAADALIVRFSETIGELGGAEHGPTLEIYGDGRAVVQRPYYMKNPGARTFRLSRAELDRLVGSLAEKGVPAFDPEGTRSAKRAALDARRSTLAARGVPMTLTYVSDAPTTSIELHLERYQPAGARAATKVDRKVTWYAVDHDAQEYPTVAPIQGLAGARKELLALFDRSDAGAQ